MLPESEVTIMEYTKQDIATVAKITSFNATKAEKLIQSVFKDLAEDEPETSIEDVLEVILMETKAKTIRQYVQAEEKKPKEKREVKLDDVKVQFLARVAELLSALNVKGEITDLAIVNPQKEISFEIGGESYSLNLVKHRPPKK
jgi:hypothetical protein